MLEGHFTGIVLATCLSKDRKVRIACLLGTLLPDIPTLIQIIINVSNGYGFSEEIRSPVWWVAHTTAHSLTLWLAALLAVKVDQYRWRELFQSKAGAFIAGGILHVLMDAISHGRPGKLWGYDYLAPFRLRLRWFIGIFDYADGGLSIIPGPAELLASTVAAMVIIALARLIKRWARRRTHRAMIRAQVLTQTAD